MTHVHKYLIIQAKTFTHRASPLIPASEQHWVCQSLSDTFGHASQVHINGEWSLWQHYALSQRVVGVNGRHMSAQGGIKSCVRGKWRAELMNGVRKCTKMRKSVRDKIWLCLREWKYKWKWMAQTSSWKCMVMIVMFLHLQIATNNWNGAICGLPCLRRGLAPNNTWWCINFYRHPLSLPSALLAAISHIWSLCPWSMTIPYSDPHTSIFALLYIIALIRSLKRTCMRPWAISLSDERLSWLNSCKCK